MKGYSVNRTIGTLVRLLVVCIALAFQSGCGREQVGKEDEPISWDSSKVRALQTQWQALQAGFCKLAERMPGRGKDLYCQRGLAVDRLFRKTLSDEDLQQLARSCQAMPEEPFTRDLTEFMARTLIALGNRESVVSLLSVRCPGEVGAYEHIEFCLAGRGNRLKDPILVLGEAYSKSRVPENRHQLAAAVRRAFGGLQIPGRNDAEFVQNAMQWYQKEKDHLEVNMEYLGNAMYVPLLSYEMKPELYNSFSPPLKREPLFKNRVAVQRLSPGASKSEPADQREYGAVSPGRDPANAARRLDGTWELIQVVVAGEAGPEEKVKGSRFVFHGSEFEVLDSQGRRQGGGRFRLGATRNMLTIDLIEKNNWGYDASEASPLILSLQEQTTAGIYRWKGEMLQLCLAGGWRRPISFNAEKGSGETLFTLKRGRP